MKVRIHSSLFDGASKRRQEEWKLSLNDLNQGAGSDLPLLTLYDRRQGGLDLVISGLSEKSILLAIDEGDWAPHFNAYGDIIGRLSSSAQGNGARSVETLDYAKKLIHDEAGEAVQELLEDHIEIDLSTGRRLFTVIFLVVSRLPEQLVTQHRLHI